MEQDTQDTQTSENNNQVKNGVLFRKPKKKSNKKIVLLIGAVVVILSVIASYFLFFSDKKDNNTPVLENENAGEVEIDKELDSDQDGLPNYIEEILGTDVNNSDTDGDGYSDFEEVKNGYDPVGDEEYMEEEWEVVKEEIRNEDENLYMDLFIDKAINWKTYQNEKYGFSFEYPDTWVINDSFDSVALSNYKNGSSSGQLKPDYVELKFMYMAKLSSQSHDDFFKIFIELLSKSVPYFKDKNSISEISFGDKKCLHIEGIISLYSCEFSPNRIIAAVIINNSLEADNIKRILSTVKIGEEESINSTCMRLVSDNNETICNVNIGDIFELFRESYQDTKECPDVPIIWGGCFLEDISYDKEYVEKLEVESRKKSECWAERIYRFKAIKKGTTEIISAGTCDYDMKYKIEIN